MNLSPHHQHLLSDISDQQGFAKQQLESLIIPKQQPSSFSTPKHPRQRARHRQPKLKLMFIAAKQSSRQDLRRAIEKKEDYTRGRSVELDKKDTVTGQSKTDYMAECLTKTKRTAVGQNISIPIFWLNGSKQVKQHFISTGVPVVYQLPKELNTHGYLRRLSSQSFLQDNRNQLLKDKIKKGFIMPKKGFRSGYEKLTKLQFSGQHQCANLQFVTMLNQKQYQVYIKNDTNTHGHQVWFSFRVKNGSGQKISAKIHVCNIKRELRLFQDGAVVFSKAVGEQKWRAESEGLQFKVNANPKLSANRLFKLSFEIILQVGQERQVSLLPSYTYSDMLSDIQKLQMQPDVTVQTLTYSLLGMAIPIVTIAQQTQTQKNVVLVNCRIHPGQTNSSYMCRGLMKAMVSGSPQTKQFLQKNIIKIIPMLNPDGVVYGNFRTNFLGIDLNRNFDCQDQITNPQVIALKQLGYRLKKQYGERFSLFIDLHGHTGQKNIFSYGPDYDTTQSNFYQIRLLPKILAMRSRFFKYSSCRFKLQDYKRYTARGFFLNQIKINAYTIQSSYSLFQQDNKNLVLSVGQWQLFGKQLAQGLGLLGKISRLSMIRSKSQMKKALGQADKQQLQVISRFKKEFKKQKERTMSPLKQKSRNINGQDSDGQNECQDYSRAQRQEVARRVLQTNAPTLVLPRVLKPAIVYPTVTPKLFRVREFFDNSNMSMQMQTMLRRGNNRYSSLRQRHLVSSREVQLLQI